MKHSQIQEIIDIFNDFQEDSLVMSDSNSRFEFTVSSQPPLSYYPLIISLIKGNREIATFEFVSGYRESVNEDEFWFVYKPKFSSIKAIPYKGKLKHLTQLLLALSVTEIVLSDDMKEIIMIDDYGKVLKV